MAVFVAVGEVERLGVLDLTAAAVGLHHRELRAAPVGQARHFVAAMAESIFHDAVFRDHQRQAAVDDGLAGKALLKIADLLVAQLKGDGGGVQPLLFEKGQRDRVEDIE